MINLDWSQILSIVLAVVIIVFSVKEIRVYPDSRAWLFGFIFWQALTILFYVMLNLDRIKVFDTPFPFTDISSILRLIGQLVTAAFIIYWHAVHKLNRGSRL